MLVFPHTLLRRPARQGDVEDMPWLQYRLPLPVLADTTFLNAMTQLLRKPFLLALILSLPLWVLFHNYVVALCVGLLVSFLFSMIDSLLTIQRQQRIDRHSSKTTRPSGPTHPDQHS